MHGATQPIVKSNHYKKNSSRANGISASSNQQHSAISNQRQRCRPSLSRRIYYAVCTMMICQNIKNHRMPHITYIVASHRQQPQQHHVCRRFGWLRIADGDTSIIFVRVRAITAVVRASEQQFVLCESHLQFCMRNMHL